MNVPEAAILSSIPIGAIVGGTLCKSFGVPATIGGVVVGGIAAGFAGWCYSFFYGFLQAYFTVIWLAARGTLEQTTPNSLEVEGVRRARLLGIALAVIASGVVGFVVWYYGLLLLLVSTVVLALLTVATEQLHIERKLNRKD